MSEMTTIDASRVLGVSQRHVNRLVADGQLDVVRKVAGANLLDPASVQRLGQTVKNRGRVWSESTSWAALALLSGQQGVWLAPSQVTRLKHRLRKMDADDVQYFTRKRATTRRFRLTPGARDRFVAEVVATGTTALEHGNQLREFGLSLARRNVEGYVLEEDIESLVEEFSMMHDPEGNVILRGVTIGDAFIGDTAPVAAVAVDLMDSLDIRERAAGRRVLERLLHG